MISFLKLIRYKNLLMVLLTMVLTKYALINSFLENTYLTNFDFLLLILSVLLITAGGYIVNDIFDIETDKINKPNKVFINVLIPKKIAWYNYFLFTLSGLFIGFYLSIKNFTEITLCLYFASIIILFLYSKFLKKLPLFGNLAISILITFPIFLVSSISLSLFNNINDQVLINYYNLENTVNIYCFFAFITTLIREIIKDIEDVDGDLKIKAKTLPILFGRKRASKVAFLCSCILLFLLLILSQFIINKAFLLFYGIVLILLPLLYFMFLLWKAEKKKDFSKLSSLMKLIMLFGILSMLLFTIQ
ncbi:geranylgeranylglycerol-phosphate geranylgeranyltransferase [Polaribacter haliotis]|uniref:Geranylgeranylglycerol-phosphate geranylgeranyltransferase n=1 Tax=Polaribacter haliotis TaxID=1888915 RepID=A0A7L8AHH6_9FLAO|nr:geranylgeranylglycerol-phosphate geranylgeranyltransferase [Polaribacter haliotis]QOD61440.1 geranylgeranylglycerol-phosphate geranylgeranyltransferase [Polaribacter haliotis]